MKRIERFLLSGAAYAILIDVLFYIIGAFTVPDGVSISLGRFMLILAFGYVISLTALITEALELKKWQSALLSYVVLLAAFIFIFLLGTDVKINGIPTVIAAVIIFTAFYLCLGGLIILAKKALSKIKLPEKKSNGKKDKSHTYTPKFK